MPDFSKPITETMFASGLVPEQCLIFGGSALALHGIREAGDLDLMVHPEQFWALRTSGTLPSGEPLTTRPDGLDSVRLSAEKPKDRDLLGIDIVSIHGFMNAHHFERLKARTEQLAYVGGVLHFANLELLRETKKYSLRPKDWLDIRRIGKQISAQTA